MDLKELSEIEERLRKSKGLGLTDCYKLIDEISGAWNVTPKKYHGYSLAKNIDNLRCRIDGLLIQNEKNFDIIEKHKDLALAALAWFRRNVEDK